LFRIVIAFPPLLSHCFRAAARLRTDADKGLILFSAFGPSSLRLQVALIVFSLLFTMAVRRPALDTFEKMALYL
jgi:hypothetical protein